MLHTHKTSYYPFSWERHRLHRSRAALVTFLCRKSRAVWETVIFVSHGMYAGRCYDERPDALLRQKEGVMKNLTLRRWMLVLGVVVFILPVVALLLTSPVVREPPEKVRRTGKKSWSGLPLKDRIALFLNYELDKRLAGLAIGLYRQTGGVTRILPLCPLAGCRAQGLIITRVP